MRFTAFFAVVGIQLLLCKAGTPGHVMQYSAHAAPDSVLDGRCLLGWSLLNQDSAAQIALDV